MSRRLLWLVVLAAILYVVRSLRGSSRRRRRASPRHESAGSSGRMVRDRVCNTFVPDGRALVVAEEGTTHYFCSEECRAVYLQSRAARAS
jgi:YHS domain-containing protein